MNAPAVLIIAITDVEIVVERGSVTLYTGLWYQVVIMLVLFPVYNIWRVYFVIRHFVTTSCGKYVYLDITG